MTVLLSLMTWGSSHTSRGASPSSNECRKLKQGEVELVTNSRRYNLARREADLVFHITPFDEPDVIQRKLMHILALFRLLLVGLRFLSHAALDVAAEFRTHSATPVETAKRVP